MVDRSRVSRRLLLMGSLVRILTVRRSKANRRFLQARLSKARIRMGPHNLARSSPSGHRRGSLPIKLALNRGIPLRPATGRLAIHKAPMACQLQRNQLVLGA